MQPLLPVGNLPAATAAHALFLLVLAVGGAKLLSTSSTDSPRATGCS
jgi:hypothetical protein